MTSIFFQAVGKPCHAVISSLTRDIICFVPLVIILPRFFGIKGILYAAPIADLVAALVMIAMTVQFMRSLKRKPAAVPETPASAIKPTHKGVIITIARGARLRRQADREGRGGETEHSLLLQGGRRSGGSGERPAQGVHSDLNANAPQILHDLYLSTDVVQQAVQAQDQIIRKIADQGSCVIVGRAADYVLRVTTM